MSGKERGLFRIIFKHFLTSITPTFTRRKLVGEDYFGTKYYEVPISSTSNRTRPTRYFEPIRDFEQEIPAAWEAWLRHRRTEPPTSEEVENDYKKAVITKLKATEKEEIASKERAALNKGVVPVKKYGYSSFPVYEEYSSTSKHEPKS